MLMITLSPQLVGELNQMATEQAVPLEQFLRQATRSYLRQLEREKIKAESRAYQAHHAQLLQSHAGQYVAFHHGQMVDSAAEFEPLHHRIRQRFGRQAVLIRQVTPEAERVLTIRSPHLERDRS